MCGQNNTRPLRWIERALVCAVFLICLAGAFLLPPELCPDEKARQLLSTWMYQNNTLPTGDELETIIDSWGFSYALRPFLSAIIAALCMRVTSVVTTAPLALLVVSRLVSILSVTTCCVYCLRLGHRLFQSEGTAILFATFVCFLPQVLFLGMYQNNDALALAATTAMLYYLVLGSDSDWSRKSLLGLGVSLSVGLLSYYTAYPWLLAGSLYFVLSLLRDRRTTDARTLLMRLGIVFGTCCLLAGWFFVRNACLHGGDPFGIAWESESRARMARLGFDVYTPCPPIRQGMNLIEFFLIADCYFIRLTLLSCVGVFGNMDILMPWWLYNTYFAYIIARLLFYPLAHTRHRPSAVQLRLTYTMLLSVVISFALHAWQSYARDFEPQGRYVIEVALFVGYLISYGTDVVLAPFGEALHARLHSTAKSSMVRHVAQPAIILSSVWIALAMCSIPTWLRMLS